jgi:hypothetical protein
MPRHLWEPSATIAKNNGIESGILMFYHHPIGHNVEIQVRFEGYSICHRRIYAKEIGNEEQLMAEIYNSIRTPLLRSIAKKGLMELPTE